MKRLVELMTLSFSPGGPDKITYAETSRFSPRLVVRKPHIFCNSSEGSTNSSETYASVQITCAGSDVFSPRE